MRQLAQAQEVLSELELSLSGSRGDHARVARHQTRVRVWTMGGQRRGLGRGERVEPWSAQVGLDSTHEREQVAPGEQLVGVLAT